MVEIKNTTGSKSVQIMANGGNQNDLLAFYGLNYKDEFQVIESKSFKTMNGAKRYAEKKLA